MNWLTKLTGRVCVIACVSMGLAACDGLSKTTSASKPQLNLSARKIVGTELIGAKGATRRDQIKIDGTVAGLCGAGTYTKSECAKHEAAVK